MVGRRNLHLTFYTKPLVFQVLVGFLCLSMSIMFVRCGPNAFVAFKVMHISTCDADHSISCHITLNSGDPLPPPPPTYSVECIASSLYFSAFCLVLFVFLSNPSPNRKFPPACPPSTATLSPNIRKGLQASFRALEGHRPGHHPTCPDCAVVVNKPWW